MTRTPLLLFLALILALALTLLSVVIVRDAPGVVGNLCGPNQDELCYAPLPTAGFPFAYWIDQGGISVPGSLGSEDAFSVLAFWGDFLIYFPLVLAAGWSILQRRSRLASPPEKE